MMKRWHTMIAIAIYSLLTLILTYPVGLRLASHIAGFKGEDNLQWRWFLWWFKHSILSLQASVIDLQLLYAPAGGEQPLYAISTLVPALALPITLLAGPTVSYNLSFLLSFVLTGFTTYLLAYYLTRSHLAALIAGLIFAFYPARIGYATGTFLGQLSVYLLPVYILALLMLVRRPNRRRAIWTAIVLACLGLTWPLHVAYGAIIFTLVVLLCQVSVWLRHPQRRVNIRYFAMAFGLTFLLIIGPYLTLLVSTIRSGNNDLGERDSVKFAVDVMAFISPSNYHPLLQPFNLLPDFATRVLADRDDIQERSAYLGLTAIFLVFLGLMKYRKKLLFWLVTALAAMTLSLGPLLKFGGSLVQVNIEGNVGYVILPYALLQSIPILDWSETLGRLNVVTMLCVAVMAAYGATYVLANLRSSRRVTLAAILAVLILLEYVTIFPFPTEPDFVPDFYYSLGQEGQFAPQQIIDLPLKGDPSGRNYSMHYQTVHQQAIAGGHFIRKPAGADEMTSFVNQLLLPPLHQSAFDFPDTRTLLGLLNQFGFTKVVVRPWLLPAEESGAQLAYLSSWLGQPHSEGEVSVFEIAQGEDAPRQLTSLLEGDAWQVAAGKLQLQSPADLLVYAYSSESQPATLQLSLSAPQPDRFLAIDLESRPFIRLYLRQERLDYEVPLSLAPGIHRFTFRPEENCMQDCAPVNISRLAVNHPETDRMAAMSFGKQLSLIKHDLFETSTSPGHPILMFLYWQGHGQLSEDYSAFVHLVSSSGQLITQADYLLGGWRYPTSKWPTDHITAVPTLIFVPAGTPPGEYQIRIGLYRAETGQRLLLNDDFDQQDSAILENIIVNP